MVHFVGRNTWCVNCFLMGMKVKWLNIPLSFALTLNSNWIGNELIMYEFVYKIFWGKAKSFKQLFLFLNSILITINLYFCIYLIISCKYLPIVLIRPTEKWYQFGFRVKWRNSMRWNGVIMCISSCHNIWTIRYICVDHNSHSSPSSRHWLSNKQMIYFVKPLCDAVFLLHIVAADGKGGTPYGISWTPTLTSFHYYVSK